MIDWKSTKEKHGIISVEGYRPKVIVSCDKCGKKSDFTIRVKSMVIDNNIEWFCPKCVCLRQEVRNKLSFSASNKWQNKDYRKERSLSSKKLWENEEYRKIHAESVQLDESKKKCSIAAKNAWKNKSSEEKKIISEKMREKSLKLWESADFRHKISLSNENRKDYISSIQKILYAILDDIGINYKIEHNIGPYNFDCFLPDYDILIECQGDYWHSLKNNIARDIKKSSYIINNFPDMKLYCIWEHEFLCKDRIVGLIKYWTGLSVINHDFNFSEISICDVDHKITLEFLGKYHYSGSTGNSKIKYGAYINGELSAVCCFGPITRKETAIKLGLNHRYVLELTRFCIHPGYYKKNFASWFISKSIKNIKKLNKHQCIISFADETHNHSGIIYKASNFQYDGEVRPSYWYADSDGWIMHKKTLYNHARSLRMTEKEFAILHGYKKVMGKKKYRYLYWL